MHISCMVAVITLDELAAVLLPARLLTAIDETNVEYILWDRRHTMNTRHQNAASPAGQLTNERILPVMVLGDMVIMPRLRPESLNFRKGRNYLAIQEAQQGDRVMLVIFVAEPEIALFKSSDPQPLPAVGVIARLTDVIRQPDDTLQVVLEVTTRATVTARLQHEPFYRATCVPHPEPDMASAEAQTLVREVKAQVEAIVRARPDLTPAMMEEWIMFVNQLEQPGQLADFINYSPTFTFEDRIAFLSTFDPVQRLRKVQRKLGA